MFKFARFISVLLLALVLAPAVLADNNKPIYIKSAVVETESSRVLGEVTVCNTERERVSFVLDIKNETINSIYKRKLSVPASDCITTELRFTTDFAEMSNIGDEIVMAVKHTRGLWSRLDYDFSDKYTTKVVKGKKDQGGCGDLKVEDKLFEACDMGFIYHKESGLRIKVLRHDYDYVQLKLTHIEWGGTKEFRIYKGRSKKIRSNYDQLTRVELTNVQGENRHDLLLKIES